MKIFTRIWIFLITGFIGFVQTAVAQTSPCDSFTVSHNPNAPVLYSPDSSMYLLNIQDTAGVFQIYVGNAGDTATTCISLNYPWSLLRP